MADRIKLRRDMAAVWALVNPVLADGELGYERDTHQFKVGDGVTPWNDLPYGGIQGAPGPPGPPGEPGPVGDANGAFLVNNRFNEIAEDEIAKVQARLNLGVQIVDGGTFN